MPLARALATQASRCWPWHSPSEVADQFVDDVVTLRGVYTEIGAGLGGGGAGAPGLQQPAYRALTASIAASTNLLGEPDCVDAAFVPSREFHVGVGRPYGGICSAGCTSGFDRRLARELCNRLVLQIVDHMYMSLIDNPRRVQLKGSL